MDHVRCAALHIRAQSAGTYLYQFYYSNKAYTLYSKLSTILHQVPVKGRQVHPPKLYRSSHLSRFLFIGSNAFTFSGCLLTDS
jgi:hypothetical protein